MIARVLATDLMKLRRKAIWFLVFLGPIGVIALQALNFGLRYDYLTNLYKDDLWGVLLENIHYLSMFALVFGMTIITSMLANIEHQLNSWKQVLALPVSRISVYTAKFILSFLLLLVSCSLLAVLTIVLGLSLQFGSDYPLVVIIQKSFYPLLAALPILALQLWLSITMKNQAIPLTVGIVGTIFGMFTKAMPDWLIWKWPTLINQAKVPEYSVYAGIIVGMFLLACGVFDFLKRDVN
ncbi:permease [Paenibacillus albiflavus]|uniref:Permease n=1 Tax=Paenibacillus albiflavus TaxID=2545760 RepID=A0A4V2WPC2_9BACL|nr:ABC transporter permease [Paenibacillus albiflavus]TCZ78792.1 permease [Paenibacillus albiflavus]